MIKSKEEIEQAAIRHTSLGIYENETLRENAEDDFIAGYNLSTTDHAEVNKWVPVSEKPTQQGKYIVYVDYPDNKFVDFAFWNPIFARFDRYSDWITNYMPLPPAPTQQ